MRLMERLGSSLGRGQAGGLAGRWPQDHGLLHHLWLLSNYARTLVYTG